LLAPPSLPLEHQEQPQQQQPDNTALTATKRIENNINVVVYKSKKLDG
jgi:hypothetical protein